MTNTENISSNAPHFAAWSDRWVTGVIPTPLATKLDGVNVFNLCFWLAAQKGPWDQAKQWQDLPQAQKIALKNNLNSRGVLLTVTAFGSTDAPTSTGCDPTTLADEIAAWAKNNSLDAVDINYEDFNAFSAGTAEEWLITFTKQLRSHLPAGKYIITHCPIAPWFRDDGFYPGGGYSKINKEVGDLIDWYNVQFFNQGEEYGTIESLLHKSTVFPETALFQIAKKGVPLSKLVIGKPASDKDAPSGGYMDPNLLAQALKQAKSEGWNGGAVAWQYPSAGGVEISQWMKTVRSLTWPVTYSEGCDTTE